MQEMEIKFKVDNLDLIKEKLEAFGCDFSELLDQKDTIFAVDVNDTAWDGKKVFTRIRVKNGKNILTLKKQTSNRFDNKEIEFEVSDFEGAKDLLEVLGFSVWVTVEKERIETKYQDFNICLDRVKYLGDFIEIEIITKEENKSEFYEKKILEVAEKLGIKPEQRINKLYDIMMSELKNN